MEGIGLFDGDLAIVDRQVKVKNGDIVVLKNRPCTVTEITNSKIGKHGHGKCKFTGTDIYNGRQIVDIVSTNAVVLLVTSARPPKSHT